MMCFPVVRVHSDICDANCLSDTGCQNRFLMVYIHVLRVHTGMYATGCWNRDLNNSNNNNNCIQRHSLRSFTISLLCKELSPTHTLYWLRHNRVQITCNT